MFLETLSFDNKVQALLSNGKAGGFFVPTGAPEPGCFAPRAGSGRGTASSSSPAAGALVVA